MELVSLLVRLMTVLIMKFVRTLTLATSVSATMVSSGSRMELVFPIVRIKSVTKMQLVVKQSTASIVTAEKDTPVTGNTALIRLLRIIQFWFSTMILRRGCHFCNGEPTVASSRR